MNNLTKEVEIKKNNENFEATVSKKEWTEPQLYIISTGETESNGGFGGDGFFSGSSLS